MLLKNLFQKTYDFRRLFGIAVSLLIFAFAAFGQVDSTFTPIPSVLSSVNNSFNGGFTVQPDGRILIYDNFQNVQGLPRVNIARLNSDSSVDVSFNCTACTFRVTDAAVQADGKIVVAGYVGESVLAPRLRRLNADGSIDTSFTPPFPEETSPANIGNRIWGFQPDGKMFVSQHFSYLNSTWSNLYRLNPNGSIDNTFQSLYFNGGTIISGPHYFLSEVKLLPDGKILVGGYHEFGQLFRVNTDGTRDTTFQSPVLVVSGSYTYIRSFDIQADGKIVMFGYFTSINGVSKNNIARLNADQSVDTSFTFPLTFGSGFQAEEEVKLQSDGKLLISGTFSNNKIIVRLGNDGSLDNSFNTPTNLTRVSYWTLDTDNRILLRGTISGEGERPVRLNLDGSRDTTFNITFGTSTTPIEIHSTAVQADGKTLLNGNFTHINGISRQNFGRLNANGSLDSTFNPGTGFDGEVEQFVFQSDGKILAVGSFGRYNGTSRTRIARINANGSLDTTFNPTLNNYVADADVQADGKIVISGNFTTVNGIARTGLARLNADGSLDNSFNPILAEPLSGFVNVYSLLVQADGKIMIGGTFLTIYGYNRQGLARLNADGTIDFSFDAGNLAYGTSNLIQQPDGKYLTGNFSAVSRRNIDGSPDTSFQPATINSSSSISAMLLQADGSILLGGIFTQINGVQRRNIAKLNPNGSLNQNFLPEGTDARVWSLSKQPDNKIIVGGTFLNIGNLQRSGIARLNYTPVIKNSLFDYDGDGRADVSVFRPSENKWYIYRSSDGQITQQIFALSGDVPVPADYDGDGKTDMAIYRPSSADWWSLSTINGNQNYAHWGEPNVVVRPSDFDGDGKADYIFFLTANSTWYRYGSTAGASSVTFGIMGDKPVTGDFDGDGKSDPAIFRPSTGDWWYLSSINNAQLAVRWGLASDIPAPADYDGDGRTDFAVYRTSTGVWYIINSSNGSFTIMAFGLPEDKPVPADYDGDGKADIAVFRPSTGIWYQMRSTAGFSAFQFGISTDIPTENVFIP